MSTPYVTPKVRAEALRNNVDLSTVQGSGVGGRIRLQDVQPGAQAAAGPRAQANVPRGVPSFVVEQPSAFTGLTVSVDIYSRNPVVDDVKQASPAMYARAVKGGPAPTLFASGDLPPLIASGEDPSLLLQLPWFARHAGSAASRAQLADMLEDAAEDPSGGILVMEGLSDHEGVFDYRQRVTAWLNFIPPAADPVPAGWDEFLKSQGIG